MYAKSLVQLGAIACLVLVFATPADAQRRRYYDDDGYGHGGCLSSDDINASLMANGWYPEALVGQSARVLYMRVSQGRRKFIASVDRCTGQVLHMRGAG